MLVFVPPGKLDHSTDGALFLYVVHCTTITAKIPVACALIPTDADPLKSHRTIAGTSLVDTGAHSPFESR
jgi:hypothetical protein